MNRLSQPAAFVAVACAFVAVMLGTTLPTPLYPLYQKSIGFGEIMVTVVFAVYAVGVLAALYFAGGLSDEIGRRRVLVPGVVLSALSAVCFLLEGGLTALFIGRVLSGLSAGLSPGPPRLRCSTSFPRRSGRRERWWPLSSTWVVSGSGLLWPV